MRTRRKPPIAIKVEPHKMGLAYCAHCGTGISDYFSIHEMVLVDPGNERPFYGRITAITMGEDGQPTATVLRSPQEPVRTHLANLRKVDS